MKILYVITELHEGGAENALWEVAHRLHQKGHGVRVVCLFGDDGAVAQRLRTAGISVASLGIAHVQQSPKIRHLRPIVHEFRPDLIHTWLFHANVLCRFVIPRKLPLVCGLRVVDPRGIHRLLDRLTRARVSVYTCVSAEVARFAVESLGAQPAQCTVIGNGVDYASFAQSRDRRRDDATLRGLTVARVSRQKGLDILIAALARVPADMDWQWKIVGDWPEPDYLHTLQQRAAELGLAAKITWCGAAPRERMVDYYRDASLFALPSRWEGQPNAVLEAMAAGVPVVASAACSAALPIENSSSLTIVSEDTSKAWTRAIVDLWGDPERMEQQRQTAMQMVASRTWAQVAERHLDLYRSLLKI